MSLPIPVNSAMSKNALKQSIYPLGKKHYESTDWLGNVRVTYTDKKSWNNGKFALNVSSSQDYYPFGSVMEGRNLEITNYRFGFQGQEGDDEIFGKNNLWAYKFRLHDARLGRFFSVDPLADKYPFYSVYQFSGNRLIDKVELEGLEPGEPGTEENQLETAPVEGNEEGPEHVWLWQNNKWVDYGQKMPEVVVEEKKEHKEKFTFWKAKMHYMFGGGKPVTVHLETIDLSKLKLSDFNEKGIAKVKLDSRDHFSNIDDALVHGTITLQRIGKTNEAEIALNSGIDNPALLNKSAGMFNFEMHDWKDPKNWSRNIATIIGEYVYGSFVICQPPGSGIGFKIVYYGGDSYPIYYEGKVKIPED
ncbi:MAG: hypothetical protein KatS3mg087_2002 [Patescibacteria group bacterium]|nr:MAG: hypothetical protein KatS3mg087_2002 [Patescibacteria group bacterium]